MVGCSHRHSNLAVRERLAFTPQQTSDALAAWRTQRPEHEAVLISTCNRVELYAAAANPRAELSPLALTHYLTEFHNVPFEDARPQLTVLEGTDVVRHLFRVAASLESMVVGEAQILSQVRKAYEQAHEIGTAGPVTHGCFQAAIRVARRVANETTLHRHQANIPSLAVAQFASRAFHQFDGKRVLVIGAGEMAQKTLRYLIHAGVREIVVLNRDFPRAQVLAKQWNGRAAAWNSLLEELALADLVVSTTGADRHIVALADYQQHVAPLRNQRPLFLLDLALPRDFDPAIRYESNVTLYGMEDLAEACEQNRLALADALPEAERIIEEEVISFAAETQHQASSSVIARFREGLETAQAAELERLYARLPSLDDRSRREIQQFSDRLVAKMLHPPLESLRNESHNGSFQSLLEALQRLFQLHKP